MFAWKYVFLVQSFKNTLPYDVQGEIMENTLLCQDRENEQTQLL